MFPRVSASDVILSSICSSSDGCRMLLSFPCRDEKCRQADAKREQRRQLLEALPIPNVSVVVDFQVNLNDSENASHAARLLNTSGNTSDNACTHTYRTHTHFTRIHTVDLAALILNICKD